MARNTKLDNTAAPQEVLPVADDDRPNIVQRFPVGCLQITAQTPPDQWPTSLVKGSPQHKAAIVNCACTPDVEVGHEWSETFRVVDWLIMVRESVDEKTGEIREYPWLALICDDGSIVGTSSQIVPHQLARVLREYTEEEWLKGIPMKIRRRMSRGGGRSYHELRVAQ